MTKIIRTIISIIIISAIAGCSLRDKGDWRQEYIKQEKSRVITIEKYFEFVAGNYSLSYIDTTLETFNEKGQILGINDRIFFKYDSSGRLIAEEFCMRTCENPWKEIYYYDSLIRLVKTVLIAFKEREVTSTQYFYNDKNLIIKKIIGNDSTSTTETYTYDSLSRMTSKTRREFNTNVKKWLTFVDSMFYDMYNNIAVKKRREIGKDLLGISRYTYNDTLLITQIDTAITTIQSYLPTLETGHHAYYFRSDYKYNSNNKIIEKIKTRPDYKTPFYKVTYEYK